MTDEVPPRNLMERSGRHYCVRCLAEVPATVYLRNDHICDACAERDEYPLASTPDDKPAQSVESATESASKKR